jgi:hypothetical protein
MPAKEWLRKEEWTERNWVRKDMLTKRRKAQLGDIWSPNDEWKKRKLEAEREASYRVIHRRRGIGEEP